MDSDQDRHSVGTDLGLNCLQRLSADDAQSVTCLTADTCLTANSGVASSLPAWSHTYVEIDCEIISTAILLPSAFSRRVFVSYKLNYMQEVLVNPLVKLATEKSVAK